MAYCAHCGSWVNQVSPIPCASCGKPTNGAPPLRAASPNPAWIAVAVIVVAMFLAIPMIGILSAVAIPNLLTAMSRSKQKRTMADMRTISVAINAYGAQNQRYPETESMTELRSALTPRYAGSISTTDAWQNELRYRCMNDGCRSYAITSSGADRIFEHVSASEYPKQATTMFDCDIVLIDGEFVQYPEGVQSARGGS